MQILSRNTMLETIKETPGFYNVVCIIESNLSPIEKVKKNAKDVLFLSFDDIEFPRYGYKMPEEKDVEKAVEWAVDKDNLIVSCQAGISRSSALAYVISCSQKGPSNAMEILKSRHYPNAVIVKLGTELLKEPEIMNKYIKFMNEKGFNY